jgi:hypothetical protein
VTASFLDTTIVIDLVDGEDQNRKLAEKYIASHLPAEVPYYALRELLSGHLQYLCQTHNILLAASNAAEAIVALLDRNPAEGRKRETRVRLLASEMAKVFDTDPESQRQTVKREVLEAIALKAAKIWRNSHRIANVSLTQHLGCFENGKITFGLSGELIGPGDSFNCVKSARCAAAAYLYENTADVQKMIDVLHPNKLDSQVSKNESQKRRKALKELLTKGPNEFNKKYCRSLGDAYFAAMSPPGFSVVTTNISDFEPLCKALAKKAVSPE